MHREYEELVSAYIDFEVTAEEEKAVREHMESCVSCRELYARGRIIKQRLRALNETIPIPQDLDKRLFSSLDIVKTQRFMPTLSLGTAFSLALLLFLTLFIVVYSFKSARSPLLNDILQSYTEIYDGKLPIQYKAENAQELKNDIDKTGNIPFEFDVDNFNAMGFKLKGGIVKDIANRKSTIFVYQGKDLIGYYIMASLKSDFPKSAKKIRNHEKGVDFYLLKREGYNFVMWKEENTTCVIVSKLDHKELLSLAVESVED